MVIQKHYIDGQLVDPPSNYEDIDIELNFEPDSFETSISVSSFDWIDAQNKLLRDKFTQGLTGGNGVFQGIPHRIEVSENGQNFTLLDGFIDLSTASYDRDLTTADSKPLAGLDWLNEVADSLTFDLLYEKGFLTDNDKVFVPYVLNSVPNYKDALLATLALYVIGSQLDKAVQELTKSIAKFPTLVDTAAGILDFIQDVLYVILLIVTAVDLLLDLVALLIQKVKFMAAMSVNRQIEAACSYLGLTFQSPILQGPTWSRLHIIPESYEPPEAQSDNRIKGYLRANRNEQSGWYKGTFGDLLRAVQGIFNARIFPENGVLKIVPRVKITPSASFTLPPYDNQAFTTNADEIVATRRIGFQVDSVDQNTLDRYFGTRVLAQLFPLKTSDRKGQLLKNANAIEIPFARAVRKDDLTGVERIVDVLLTIYQPIIFAVVTVANGAIGVVNGFIKAVNRVKKALRTIGIKVRADFQTIDPVENPRIDQIIDNRIGMMLLEKDLINVPKLALLDVNSDALKTKLSFDNQTKVNAVFLYKQFHEVDSFAPTSKSAQRFVYEYNNVEMRLRDVINVRDEGAVKLPDGTIAEVVSCRWNSSTRKATFVVKVKRLFTNNLKEVIIAPSGR